MINLKAVRKIGLPVVALVLVLCLAPSAPAQTAPDATGRGPFATTSAEYKFPAAIDPDISALPTELWARVYRPTDLSQAPFPLVIFLHGNHATCGRIAPSPPFPPGLRIDDNTQYTFYGDCPPTSPIVTPNHAGYTYLADQLASWGYIAVSINANRGINAAPGRFGDAGLNLTRGRLVLRHLQRLSEWNSNPDTTPPSLGVDLSGTLDFNHVGLLGHSRGGEGMRAAYNQYRDLGSPWPARIPDPVNFEAIFEIGPVDGQTARVLNADGTAWNVLLPMCDGDVFNLQGVKPFDRMMRILTDSPATQKSVFTVWGANHNFYNTEWQLSDSDGCFGAGNPPLFGDFIGSPRQRQTSLASVLAFFRGNVGAVDATFNQNFNPLFDLPPVVTAVTRVDRGFISSPNSAVTAVFEDFTNPAGTNSNGPANDAGGITITHRTGVPNHDPTQRAAFIAWSAPGGFFQTNWTTAGAGRDASGFATLDLRVSRQCAVADDVFCRSASPLNPAGPTNFTIQLAMADGSLSDPIPLNAYTDLRGPIGAFFVGFGPVLHPILQTVRIPLGDFGSSDLNKLRGVRLTFDDTPTGAIYLANIRLSTTFETAGGLSGILSGNEEQPATPGALVKSQDITDGNRITLRSVTSATALGNLPGIEVIVTSNQPFPVRDELAVLKIGGREFNLSRYPDTGETNTLIFTLTGEEFALTNTGDEVIVQYGSGESPVRWNFGPLNKSLVIQ